MAADGARVVVEFAGGAMASRLRRLARFGADRPRVLRAIGAGLLANAQDRFDEERDPYGVSWPGLNPAYAATKRGAGILREGGMRGGLQGSLTFDVEGADSVVVGSNKIYAAVHQFGATIRAKKAGGRLLFRGPGGAVWGSAEEVTIPARPYLGFSDEDRETTLDVLDAFLGGAGGVP